MEKDKFYEARLTWIKALESGRYKQGTGYLRKDDRYCCLGVACEVSGLNLPPSPIPLNTTEGSITCTYGGNSAVPPQEVLDVFNINGREVNRLVGMNDHEERSFYEIAAYLRNLWGIPRCQKT